MLSGERLQWHRCEMNSFSTRVDSETYAMPLAATAIIIAALAVYYFWMLPGGYLHHIDEFWTLDRSHSFTIRNDWLSVYTENKLAFKKPPLQYWLTAWLMDSGVGINMATRLPSFVFGICVLGATGLLAYVVMPSQPWTIPAAIVLAASSKRFWESSTSALLDTGATLFATLALAATFLAIKNPRWWYVVGASCGVAALQKAPIPIAFSLMAMLGIIFSAPSARGGGRALFCNRHFFAALVIAVLLISAWPLLQWLRYGDRSVQVGILHEKVGRFAPFGDAGKSPGSVFDLVVEGEPFLRVPAIIALFWLPWRLKRRDLLGLPIAILAYTILISFAGGHISARYSLLFLPILVVGLVAVIMSVVPQWRWRWGLVGFVSLIHLGPFKTASALSLYDDNQQRYVPFLTDVSNALQPDETLIYCSSGGAQHPIRAGAISYYASNGRPIYRIKAGEDLLKLQTAGVINPPYRGVCPRKTYNRILPFIGEREVVEAFGDYIEWAAEDAADGGTQKP